MEYWQNLDINDLENEIWKDIVGYEGLYKISNLGRVKSLARKFHPKEKILQQRLDKDSYARVDLSKIDSKPKRNGVHRLVAFHFTNNYNNLPQVNHKDGVKLNNCSSNLEWCTNINNIKHSWKIGLRNKQSCAGEKCYNSKLKNDDILFIRESYKNKVFNQRELAKQFNIGYKAISKIVNFQRWKHI